MAYTQNNRSIARSRNLRAYHEWARRQWENAFTEDYHHDFMLVYLRAKLLTMEHYNSHLSYAANGPYYGRQIQKAIKMIDIILAEGGLSDYSEHDGYMAVPKSFQHYVNMRNRARIPRPDDGGLFFESETQQLRFDKAWMLLWKILSERSMTWGD